MSSSAFSNVSEDKLKKYLVDNYFPEEYTTDKVRAMIAAGEITPSTLVEYLEDANSQLFDTEVIGAEVYVSTDDGQTWAKTHDGYLDRLYNSYGYYFGQIRVSPFDPDKLYIMGVPILRSDDGGASWKSINGDNVHGDHHALWVSDELEGHIILGNDGGINISYDDGEHWIKCNSPAVGQFYSVHTDRADPYRVYGGLQDNGVWGGSHQYPTGTRWHSSGDYPYDSYLGGDGMQVQVDFRDNNTLYTGYQFGHYYRIDMATRESEYITPRHKLTERPYRWNWQSPLALSRHQQDIVYLGSNMLHRSFDQGAHFETISGDLTQGGRKGDVSYGTLTTISESPVQFGVLYVGSDDGLIHVTKDFGNTWELISASLPQDLWVSRVRSSSHSRARVYCALSGYRWDDFSAYLYVSEDYGNTWTSIAENLPAEPINVIVEDPHNEDLLFVGTDHGLYISIDRGESFMSAGESLPAVPVHDLDIQPEARDLLLGTHGRSFYRADIAPLEELTGERLEEAVIVFQPEEHKIRHSERWGNRSADWQEFNEPTLHVCFYSSQEQLVEWHVLFKDVTVNSGVVQASLGLNYMDYDMTVGSNDADQYKQVLEESEQTISASSDNGQIYLSTGEYTFVMSVGDTNSETYFEVK